jgi:hypothetical protein
MNVPETPTSRGEGPDPRAERLTALAAHLGVELAPFDGPLDAFQLDGHRGADDPVYLGGDLHAVHPDACERRPRPEHDDSLDAATIAFDDLEQEKVEAVAVTGIWCLVLRGDQVDSAPYFSLWDTHGLLRTWLLLPPARLMIGPGHLWLPSVPPRPESPGLAKSGR